MSSLRFRDFFLKLSVLSVAKKGFVYHFHYSFYPITVGQKVNSK